MEIKFIQNTIKSTFFLAVFCSLFINFYFSFFDALSFLVGSVWACANLVLIKSLVENLLVSSSRRLLKILGFLAIKFPLLYFIGYLLLSNEYLLPINILLGFSLIFIVIFFNGLKGVLFGKLTLVLLLFFTNSKLHASLAVDVPEVPNLISLLNKYFHHSEWTAFLHHWDSLIFSIILSTAISIAFFFGTRKRSLVPSGFQNFLEWIIENLRNFILEVLGPEGEKYVPFLGTLFIYILSMNWLVLIPFMKPPTSNLNITIALAICVFALVQYLNIKNYGFFGFLYHMAGSPKGILGWVMVPLMLPIEILTQLTRPVTLALRLFGNVVGEDILIGAFAMFGVVLLSAYAYDFPVGLPLQIPFMFLALLTGLMQALVFTLLSTIYILLSMPDAENHASD